MIPKVRELSQRVRIHAGRGRRRTRIARYPVEALLPARNSRPLSAVSTRCSGGGRGHRGMPDIAPLLPEKDLILESDVESTEPQRPVDLNTLFLGGLLLLAVLTAINVAAEIVLPIVLA